VCNFFWPIELTFMGHSCFYCLLGVPMRLGWAGHDLACHGSQTHLTLPPLHPTHAPFHVILNTVTAPLHILVTGDILHKVIRPFRSMSSPHLPEQLYNQNIIEYTPVPHHATYKGGLQCKAKRLCILNSAS
jgi:hypothetical protein